MSKFLLDENLSPKLAPFLRKLGYQASSVRELSLKGQPDEKLIKFAQKEGWIIITCDLGFGEVFYFNTAGRVSFIILRSPRQSLSLLQEILKFLHKEGILKEDLEETLIVASPNRLRRRVSPPLDKEV